MIVKFWVLVNTVPTLFQTRLQTNPHPLVITLIIFVLDTFFPFIFVRWPGPSSAAPI